MVAVLTRTFTSSSKFVNKVGGKWLFRMDGRVGSTAGWLAGWGKLL